METGELIMLLRAEEKDIATYADLAYACALQGSTSSYPCYADGIKTKADFLTAAHRAVQAQTEELLLFSENGRVLGWLSYEWIAQDKYLALQSCNLCDNTAQALTELSGRLRERFPGYAAYFGFPEENREAVSFLRENGFFCIERSQNHSFFFQKHPPAPFSDPAVVRITRDNFHMLRAVYHPDAKTYWNCERLYKALDDWHIFVYREGETPLATVFFSGKNGWFEIFGLEFSDGVFRPSVCRCLLSSALSACRELGADYMTYFCTEAETEILRRLGFVRIGTYLLYEKTL